MSRTIGSHGPRTLEAIMSAGLELIYEHGYEAISLRQLAAAVGIQPGSLYNHIASKQDLLVNLVTRHLSDLLKEADEALTGIDDPEAALRAFVAFHLRYHMLRKREIYIANSELRSLELDNRRAVMELRRAYERKLIGILDRAVGQGRLTILDTHVAAYSILAMLTGVANWYRPDGARTVDELVEMHSVMVFRGLALAPSAVQDRPRSNSTPSSRT